MALSAVLVAVAVAAMAPQSPAQSLFSSGGGTSSLIQDRRAPRASHVGDILTVLITESTSASNRAQVETSKEAEADWQSGKALGFIPGFSLGSQATNSFQGEGTTVREQAINARVSVTVVEVRPNGDLVVEGSRVIEINGEREVIHLTGSINPYIIPASNVIESYRLADLQVSYKGKGVASEGSRPGLFVRILNWVF